MNRLLFVCLLIIVTISSIPNCVWQSNNICTTCYDGFKLENNKCDKCKDGYLMYNTVCLIASTYYQITGISNQSGGGSNTGTGSSSSTSSGSGQSSSSSSSGSTTKQTVTTSIVGYDITNPSVLAFLQSFGLMSKVPSNCQIFTTDFKCTTCNNGYTTLNGYCTPNTGTGSTSTSSSSGSGSNSGSTPLVNNGDSSGSSGSVSSSYSDPYCQIASGSICSQCYYRYYFNTIAGRCDYVNSLCATWNPSNGACTSCYAGYIINGITCVLDRSSSSSTSSSSNTGSPVTTTPTSTYNDAYCLSASGSVCTQCYYRYYFNTAAGRCIQVNDACASWNSQGACLTCYAGYHVNGTGCSLDVAPSSGSSASSGSSGSATVTNGDSSGSSSNDPNCQILSGSVCSQCYYRYFFSAATGKCAEVNPQCATWNNNGACLTCYSGYALSGTTCNLSNSSSSSSSTNNNPSGNPVNNNNGGAVIISSNSDPNCQSSYSDGSCAQCYYGYYYSSQNRACTAVSPLCKTWNVYGSCLTCYQGYSLSGSTCILNNTGSSANNGGSNGSGGSSGQGTVINNGGSTSVTSSDTNCQIVSSNGACSQCYYSFYYNSTAGRCVSVNPLCKTWNSFGQCLSCYSGYQLISSACQIEQQFIPSVTVNAGDLPSIQDPYCNQYQNQVCIKCATRTYLDLSTNRCTQVDGNCKSWNNSTGVCTQCYDGYYIYNQKSCYLTNPEVLNTGGQLKSSLNSDVNCRASDSNGICTQCIFRFVLNQSTKVCMKVNDLCKTWNQSTALCLTCYGGYSLSNGVCAVRFN